MTAELSFEHSQCTKVIFGTGATEELPHQLRSLDLVRPLVVTDRNLSSTTEIPDKVLEILKAPRDSLFANVEPETSISTVDEGGALARELQVDCVVSVGGGSAMDTAKGIALLATLGGVLREHEGYHAVRQPLIPHFAVPTTAGTGSEVTIFSVIWDEEREQKFHLVDSQLVPNVALLDPTLTVGLSPALTAGTGMDVITHAIEAIQSPVSQPISDSAAMGALRLARRYLPRAVEDGNDLEARGQMLIASSLAGFAFSNAQVGLAHAMAHTFGPRYHVHHGTANGIVLPHVIEFNSREPGVAQRYELAAEALGVGPGSTQLASAVATLVKDLGLPTSLSSVGVRADALPHLAESCLNDGAIVYNPRPVTEASDVLPIWEAAFGDRA